MRFLKTPGADYVAKLRILRICRKMPKLKKTSRLRALTKTRIRQKQTCLVRLRQTQKTETSGVLGAERKTGEKLGGKFRSFRIDKFGLFA